MEVAVLDPRPIAQSLPSEFAVRELLQEVARMNRMLPSNGDASVWGVEGSGYGREISIRGVDEFLNEKLILVSDEMDPTSET